MDVKFGTDTAAAGGGQPPVLYRMCLTLAFKLLLRDAPVSYRRASLQYTHVDEGIPV